MKFLVFIPLFHMNVSGYISIYYQRLWKRSDIFKGRFSDVFKYVDNYADWASMSAVTVRNIAVYWYMQNMQDVI